MAYDQIFDNIGVNSLPPQFSTAVDVTGASTPNFLANGGIPEQQQPSGAGASVNPRSLLPLIFPIRSCLIRFKWNLGVQHVFAKD